MPGRFRLSTAVPSAMTIVPESGRLAGVGTRMWGPAAGAGGGARRTLARGTPGRGRWEEERAEGLSRARSAKAVGEGAGGSRLGSGAALKVCVAGNRTCVTRGRVSFDCLFAGGAMCTTVAVSESYV